jgi:hypothetical protein
VENIAAFGFTERQARFLLQVLLHSGVFLERQYCHFAGIVHGQKSTDCAPSAIIVRFGIRCVTTSTTADGCAGHHAFDARSVLVTVQGSSLRAGP